MTGRSRITGVGDGPLYSSKTILVDNDKVIPAIAGIQMLCSTSDGRGVVCRVRVGIKGGAEAAKLLCKF